MKFNTIEQRTDCDNLIEASYKLWQKEGVYTSKRHPKLSELREIICVLSPTGHSIRSQDLNPPGIQPHHMADRISPNDASQQLI
jgi:hypothetical protein